MIQKLEVISFLKVMGSGGVYLIKNVKKSPENEGQIQTSGRFVTLCFSFWRQSGFSLASHVWILYRPP
jgi:hypothetical protein